MIASESVFRASSDSHHTNVVIKAVLNQQNQEKDSQQFVSIVRPKDQGNKTTTTTINEECTTYIVVHPYTGVFYSDYSVVLVGDTKTIKCTPMPMDWTGLYDEREDQHLPFIKTHSNNHIYKVEMVCPGAVGDSGQSSPVPPTLAFSAVQVDSQHKQAPIYPPNIFSTQSNPPLNTITTN